MTGLQIKIAGAISRTQAWSRGECINFIVHPEPLNDVSRRKLRGRTPFATVYPFICQFCRSRSKRKESCSRFECRKKIGLTTEGKKKLKINLCKFCGGTTKYVTRICTTYECRKKAGTVYMYKKKDGEAP